MPSRRLPDRHTGGVSRTAVVLTACLLAALAAVSPPSRAHDDPPGKAAPAGGDRAAGAARKMVAVGHVALGAGRTNGDVWLHRGHAYVGDWDTSRAAADEYCEKGANEGVAVVDVRRPSRPRLVARIPLPTGTWAEDVEVHRARYGPQAGLDVAVVGLQVCGGPRTDASFFRGLTLWDVTRPAMPVALGRLDTGCCAAGVHTLHVVQRADLGKIIAFLSVPNAELPDETSPSGRRDRAGRGEVRLVDLTDAAAPQELASFGLVAAGLRSAVAPRGCAPLVLAHEVNPSPDGKLAFVSYWDAGVVILDTSDPARPVYRGRTPYPAQADGDAHSAVYDPRRKILFTADEDFCRGGRGGAEGWGFLRVFDVSRPASPRQIGSFRTPGSRTGGDGNFTIHIPVLVGNLLYASWYGDGVRVLDVRIARRPREVAFFVPPGGAAVWGVVVDRSTGLAYASDMRSGLWILRRTR